MLGSFSPRELASTIRSLRKMRALPPQPWCDAFFECTAAYLSVGRLNPQVCFIRIEY